MFSQQLFACSVCMAPGHVTTEAIGYAILALLLILGPLLVGVIAFFVKINRHAKAFAEQEQAEALLS